MPDIVRLADGRPARDPRRLHRDASPGAVPALSAWLGRPAAARGDAVWLPADGNVALLAPHLATLRLVALEFPRAADGRAYSQAALLRLRHGYRGELRATGAIPVDQFGLLRRLGFDSVELAPHQLDGDTLATIRRVLARYADAYQGAVDEPLPAWRRRARPARRAVAA